MKPGVIESLSFSIIDNEAGDHGFNPEEWNIVRRMIHTSADFDYIRSIRFHPDAIASGIRAIQNGCTIITDTHMAKVGIRKGETEQFGCETRCFITDFDVVQRSVSEQMTRAEAAVDKAASTVSGGVYVVGNAPTALLRLIRLMNENKARPDLVIGFPVGFVNAAESKDELIRRDNIYISNIGRKGGSNVAASVVNALAIMAAEPAT